MGGALQQRAWRRGGAPGGFGARRAARVLRRSGVAVAAASLAATGLAVAPVQDAQAAPTLVWSAPAKIIPPFPLGFQIACASSTLCVGGNGQAGLTAWHGSSWTTPLKTYPRTYTRFFGSTVACAPGTTFCIGAGTHDSVTYDGTSWSTPPIAIEPRTTLDVTGISCVSSTFCMAVNFSGKAMLFDGTSWSAPVSVGTGAGLTDVSCASSTFCVAVSGPEVDVYDGSSWTASPSPKPGELVQVSCPTTSFCMAAGGFTGPMYVATYDGTSWSSVKNIVATVGTLGGSGIFDLSCASASFCLAGAGGPTFYLLAYNGATWSTADRPATWEMGTASCPSVTFCMVSGETDTYMTGTPPPAPVTPVTWVPTSTTPGEAAGDFWTFTNQVQDSSLDRITVSLPEGMTASPSLRLGFASGLDASGATVSLTGTALTLDLPPQPVSSGDRIFIWVTGLVNPPPTRRGTPVTSTLTLYTSTGVPFETGVSNALTFATRRHRPFQRRGAARR